MFGEGGYPFPQSQTDLNFRSYLYIQRTCLVVLPWEVKTRVRGRYCCPLVAKEVELLRIYRILLGLAMMSSMMSLRTVQLTIKSLMMSLRTIFWI